MPIVSGGGGGGGGTQGTEIGYDQVTSNVNIVSTTEATGTTIITCAAHVFDGAAVLATFFAPVLGSDTAALSDLTVISLFEAATQIGRLCAISPANTTNKLFVGVSGVLRFTPTAASHTYTVTAFSTSATGTPSVIGGAGGTGVFVPAFIRFTKV